MPKAMLVYNPNSGRFPSWMLVERAAEVLKDAGWDLTIEQSQGAEHIITLARQAAEEKKDAFFIVGGDGSVNLATQGLIGSQTALGVLPSGTANVLAQELGLPGLGWTRWLALEESARQLAHAQAHWVDVGWCNQKSFLLWAGVGLDAFIVHQIEPRQPWEKYFSLVQYITSAVWSARLFHGMDLHIRVQGEEISGHYILAVVSNIHLYAGGLAQLSPDARLDDGLMDLWLFQGESMTDSVQRALEILSGRHIQSEQITCIPFSSCSMESDSQLFVQVDGEPVNTNSPVEIRVEPHAMKVLVPEQTPHLLFSELE